MGVMAALALLTIAGPDLILACVRQVALAAFRVVLIMAVVVIIVSSV